MRSARCPSAATGRVCARNHGWMSTAPSWLPLAVAGIGVLGTLAGGIAGALIAQRWADRRDDKAWARERARTFEHRRAVFEDFYEAVKALARTGYDHGHGFTDSAELPGDWHQDAAAKLRRLEFYADRRVASAA